MARYTSLFGEWDQSRSELPIEFAQPSFAVVDSLAQESFLLQFLDCEANGFRTLWIGS
jgi:hypothetical protein